MAIPELFPTTVIGSMPRPPFVTDLLEAQAEGSVSSDDFRKRMDAAVDFVIALQEHVGIDIISDGEWRRLSYVDIVSEIMDGFELVDRPMFGGTQCVVRDMMPKKPGIVAEEARYLKDHSSCGVKVCLPSPYLIGTRCWEPDHSGNAYPTREGFMEALVPVIREELLAVREVGVDCVQLDEPHLCVFVDEGVRRSYGDPERQLTFGIDLLNQIVEGVDGVTIAVHLCRRNWGRMGWGASGGYEYLVPYLNRLENIDVLMTEFAIPAAGDMAVLKELREDFKIGLGCVDVRFEEIESPEKIAARVEEAMDHVAPERLLLNPD